MKTILFPMFINSSKGGMQQIVLDLIIGLNAKGFNCIYVGYKNSELSNYYKSKGIETVELLSPNSLFSYLLFMMRLYKEIYKFGKSLIITNDIFTHILLSLYPLRKKEIFVSHGGDYKSKGKEFAAKTGRSAQIAKLFTFKRIKTFVAVSDTQKIALVNNAKIRDEYITIIYNGYNLEYPSVKKVLDRNKFKISIIGYIKRLKNQELLLPVIKKLRDEGYDCKLNLYGSIADEIYYNELKEKISFLKIEDYVYFHGFISDKSKVYMNSDIVVSCSHHEGFGLSLVEAMAHYVPTIAYAKAAGPSIIIDNYKTGILVQENISSEYYKAIKKYLDDNNFYNEVQDNSYVVYEKKFATSTMVDKYYQLIQKL